MEFYAVDKSETNSALFTGVQCDCKSKTFSLRMSKTIGSDGDGWIRLTCVKCGKTEYFDY